MHAATLIYQVDKSVILDHISVSLKCYFTRRVWENSALKNVLTPPAVFFSKEKLVMPKDNGDF